VSRASYRERVNERLRLLQIYEVFLRYGSDALFDRGIVGDLRRPLQGWFYQTQVEALSAPEKVRLILQELGPTYVKLGQIVSTRADTLPSEWETELAKLQSHVRPFPVEEARGIIESELGDPPEKLYDYFDPTPLAAASLAQVHRAALPDGMPVIVKVQRPNIESRVRADLLILERAARFAERRSLAARELGVLAVIEEFGAALLLELDYRIEAYNARRLARNLEPLPGVAVPTVIRDLSARRVLTASFVNGAEANNRDLIVASGLDPIEIADHAVRAAVKMILVDGFFHADPHPGNVLVDLDTGDLTFIDTGMVGELGLRQRMNLVALLYTSTKNDPYALAKAMRAVSEPFRETNAKTFDDSFARRVGPLMDVPEGEVLDLAGVISISMDLLRDSGYRPDPQLSLAMKAMTQSAEFMKVLYPPGHANEFGTKAIAMTRELVSEHLTEDRVADFVKRQVTYVAGEAVQQLPSLQEATNMWLKQYRKGRLEVKFDTSDLEPRIQELRDIARAMTLGVIVVGVLIASAIVANVPKQQVSQNLRNAALITCALALVVAATSIAVLAWGAIRQRRKPDRTRPHK
jgi:ubiquinone biosynthesis protein